MAVFAMSASGKKASEFLRLLLPAIRARAVFRLWSMMALSRQMKTLFLKGSDGSK
jgi:hypothetical protein